MKMESDLEDIKTFWEKVSQVFYTLKDRDHQTFSRKDEEMFYRTFHELKSRCFSKDDVDIYGDLLKLKERVSLQRDDCNDRQILVENHILEQYTKILVSLSRDRMMMKRKRNLHEEEEEDISEILEAKRRQRRQLSSTRTFDMTRSTMYETKTLPLIKLLPKGSCCVEESNIPGDFQERAKRNVERRNEEIALASFINFERTFLSRYFGSWYQTPEMFKSESTLAAQAAEDIVSSSRARDLISARKFSYTVQLMKIGNHLCSFLFSKCVRVCEDV